MKPFNKINIVKDLASEIGINNYSIDNYILLYDNNDQSYPLQKLKGKGPIKVEQMMFVLITGGSITIDVNDEEEVTLRQKDCIVITPDSILEIKNYTTDFNFQMHVFCQELVKDTFKDLNINYNLMSLSHIFKHKQCDEESYNYRINLYKELKEELSLPQYKYQKLFARAFSNLIFINNINLFNLNETTSKRKTSKQINVFKKFLELLNTYSVTNREVQFYAEKLNITPKYLSAVTIEYSGKNASKWIDEYVITKAKNLLREQRHSIKSVSMQLNFPSQSFFGRYFKRITGMSPKQFINEQNASK